MFFLQRELHFTYVTLDYLYQSILNFHCFYGIVLIECLQGIYSSFMFFYLNFSIRGKVASSSNQQSMHFFTLTEVKLDIAEILKSINLEVKVLLFAKIFLGAAIFTIIKFRYA